MKRKKHVSVFRTGFLLLLVSALFLSAKLFSNNSGRTEKRDRQPKTSDEQVVENYLSNKNLWTRYYNEEYSIKFSYPNFLTKVEYRNEGGYDYFLVFEENNTSKGKGIAFGVKKGVFENEKNRIKNDILSEDGIKFVREGKLFKWDNALVMEFEPENEEDLESRSILLIENEDLIFSFSTVPYQIQALIDSIEILE